MSHKIKVTQYFFTNLIDSAHSSFYIERRPKGKWLCYKESELVMAQMKVSKKSFQALMRFSSGVQCQKFLTVSDDDNCDAGDSFAGFDEDDDGIVEEMWGHHGRRGHHHYGGNLPAVIHTVVKKEPAPFIMQVFIPS